MWHRKSSFWYRLAALFLVLALIVPALCACGNENKTATPTVANQPPVFGGAASATLEAGAYRLTWAAASDDNTKPASIRYEMFESGTTSVQSFNFDSPIGSVVGSTSMDVPGLDIAKPHYFIVRAYDEEGSHDANLICMTDRLLHLGKAPNFRDFGGYITTDGRQIKWGMVYRSDVLNKLTDADLDKVNSLGLHRIFDLRDERDFKQDGYDRNYAGNEAIYDMLPLSHGDPYLMSANVSSELALDLKQVDFPNFYVNLAEDNKDLFKQIFERLADPSQYPVLIHCTHGKDRTGVTCALILMLLGIPGETIVRDYMLTCEVTAKDIEAKIQWIQSMSSTFAPGVTMDDWAKMSSCLEDSMENLITYINTKYNGIAGFLESSGITAAEQQTIKDLLLMNN